MMMMVVVVMMVMMMVVMVMVMLMLVVVMIMMKKMMMMMLMMMFFKYFASLRFSLPHSQRSTVLFIYCFRCTFLQFIISISYFSYEHRICE